MRPNAQVQYISATGRLSIEGMEYLDRLAREVQTLRAEVDTLKTQVADHEARISALEP